MNNKFFMILFQVLIFFLVLFIDGCKQNDDINTNKNENIANTFLNNNTRNNNIIDSVLSIDELTKESVVIPYLKKFNRLPDYYVTKNYARRFGWDAYEGNLCDVLPGKAIGGDKFFNRERKLPYKKGRVWFEADLNYSCEHRNSDRVIFSNDGLIYVTYDHYKRFIRK